MKLQYDPKSDSLYIDFKDASSVDSVEAANGVVIDLDKDGNIVGIDIEHASQKLDLASIEAVSLPAQRVKVG